MGIEHRVVMPGLPLRAFFSSVLTIVSIRGKTWYFLAPNGLRNAFPAVGSIQSDPGPMVIYESIPLRVNADHPSLKACSATQHQSKRMTNIKMHLNRLPHNLQSTTVDLKSFKQSEPNLSSFAHQWHGLAFTRRRRLLGKPGLWHHPIHPFATHIL